jgi:cyanophycin synthetase
LQINIKKKVFNGPNLIAKFPGVFIEFDIPYNQSYLSKNIFTLLDEISNQDSQLKNITVPQEQLNFTHCTAIILSKIYHPIPFHNSDTFIFNKKQHNRTSWIYLRFLQIQPALLAIKLSLHISFEIFKSLFNQKPTQISIDFIHQQLKKINSKSPSLDMQKIISGAMKRNIPIYFSTDNNNRIIQYGQGALSKLTLFTVTQKDSSIGKELSQQKDYSNELVQKLGFPSVRHYLTKNFQQVKDAAKALGYPLVLKPVDGALGNGITTSITDEKQLKDAFHFASKFKSRGILVEEHLPGIDHRIMVYNGKVIWVSAKYPPSVTGDGKHSISELIEIENKRRTEEKDAKKIISCDDDTQKIISLQGFQFEDCPKQGELVTLGKVSNYTMGGTSKDVTHKVHPDNIHMAETVTRSFHLTVMGIDFMTEDISKSWRETKCGIIETNHIPGIVSDKEAQLIADNLFSNKQTGRIPSILILTSDKNIPDWIVSKFESEKINLGQITNTQTILNKVPRGKTTDSISQRVSSLILDPTCEAILVSSNETTMIQHGLPLDKFDLGIISKSYSKFIESLSYSQSQQIIIDQDIKHHKDEINNLIDQLILNL